MTDSTKTTDTTQSSETNPWAPTMGLLGNLVNSYGGQSTAVTPGQSSALANLNASAAGVPNMGDSATGAVNNLFSSNTSPQVGMLQNAYGNLQSNLGATASGTNLDPYKTPGFSDAINTMTNDITNQVKGVYAGAGRDPSGAGSFAGSLGRGLTQGIAPTIAAQANQNTANMMNANNTLFGGANTTAQGITGLNQTQLTNGIAGLQGASMLPGLYTSPAATQLAAANTSYQQPYQNLSALLQPSAALAGLGSSSNGQSNSTQTQQGSLLSSIMGGVTGGLGALGSTGAFGSGGWMSSMLPAMMAFSDARVKDDIQPVGALADGQPLYSFKYKGDSRPQIGLLAQDVEKRDPGAVVEIGGIKAVDYGRATARARHIARGGVGHLRRAA